jgi:pimeloyl-ACP methyl ester carboxylesterase/DNA-binding CsgD family transcriptional regulator
MRDFISALTRYAIDPGEWSELLEKFDRLGSVLESWDPTQLIAELSRAEALSWRLKQEGEQPEPAGFAYLLLDDQDRVTGSSDSLGALGDYLFLADDGTLRLTHPDSQASLGMARENLTADARGHSLVSLSHATRPRHRYGFLIARSEFPPQLERIAGNATRALFIAEDGGDSRLKGVVQASFGLTAMETDVTMKLAHGMTLKEAAQELGISVNTARNHLQSVFLKSGINRQSDLVLVVTQLSVILAGTESDLVRTARKGRPQAPGRHFMILPDGRRIAYRTYGDSMGRPVVYLHETLGCSLLPPGTDDLARAFGLFLIAPDRAGFGFSDVNPDLSFASVEADLLALLDHLRVPQATLLGFLSGGAYALWTANHHPERIERLVLVASRPPRPMRGRFRHLMPLYTKMVTQPWVMSSFFNILRNRASADTNARLITSVYGSVPHDGRYLEEHPDMFDHMIAYTSESMTVSTTGVSSELGSFAAIAEEPFRPGPPISAWHGGRDRLAALEDLVDYLKGGDVTWHKFDDAGSLIVLEHWRDILQDAGSPPGDR